MEDELTQLLARLEHEWAPAMLDAAARIVFWDAVGALMVGIVAAAICAVTTRYAVRSGRLCWEITKARDERYRNDEEMGHFAISMTCGVTAIFAAIFVAGTLLNIWNWVALFDPRLAVAHRVLELVLRGVK